MRSKGLYFIIISIIASTLLVGCANKEQLVDKSSEGQPIEKETTSVDHEHSYTSAVTKEATCFDAGETTYTCSCGDSYTEEIAKIEHTESDWIIVKEVDGAENGLKQKVCTNCNTELASEEILPEVVASGKLPDAKIEWKIIGTTLYVSGTGEIPDFKGNPAKVKHFPQFASELRDWQLYDEIVEKIVIDEGITKIGENNFAYFRNVKEIVFADSVTEVGNYACTGLGIETIDFNKITKLGIQAFGELKNIKSFTIPGTIKKLSFAAFYLCESPNLTEIYVEEGVEVIEEAVFERCSNGINLYLPSTINKLDIGGLAEYMTVHVKAGSYAESVLNEDGHFVLGLTVIAE